MSVLSSRYANALFQAATAAGELDAVRAAVEGFDRALAEDDARNFVLSRQIDKRVKAEALLQSVAGAPATFSNFLRLVIDRAVERVLPSLGEEFARLDRRSRGEATCVVETARPLTEDELGAIRAKLEKHFGLKLRLEVVERPELIGGFRATVDAQRVDASVRKRLTELHRSLSEVAG